MEVEQELTIVGWPARPLPLPHYGRWRFRLDEQDGRLRAEPLARATVVSGGDTCLRLAELEIADHGTVVEFLNEVGAPLDVAASEHSFEDVDRVAGAVREAVAAWRILAGDPPPTEALGRHAAELLGATLTQALRPLHPAVWLGYGTYDRDLAASRDISLETVCFVEIYNHVVSRVTYRACQNTSCGRLFAADAAASGSSRRRSLYCSRACAHAQAQREFRRRRAERSAQA